MDQIQIGRFIANLRKEHNMTQLNLAERLGVTDRAISKWENGRGLPDVSLMKPLCEILGITVTELLNGERTSEGESVNTVEETVLDVLTDRENQVKDNKRLKKRLRIAAKLFCFIIGLILANMIFNGLIGEGYSVYTALQTQKAKIVISLIEKEKYEEAVRFIGFSGRDKEKAKENWVAGMKTLSENIRIESIDITSIELDDYFPIGNYLMTIYDLKSQVRHIYQGFVTCQNGGITFGAANVPYNNKDFTRGEIACRLEDVFFTYNPG
ncbi:MAG: helix-turn-helix transcriptional regulator [Clostridia bacterium]|nr:helix-turn-helix transcriptional regulator [Clostridia bacterium]